MLFTRGEGECLGLEPDEFEDILSSGEKVLSPVEPAPVGFVAPAWLIEPALYAVLKSRNYLYTTRQTAIVDLVNNRTITSPAVVLRGSSRFMNRFSRFLNTMLLTFLTRLDIVRVAIHPADIRYDAHNWYSKVLKQLMRNRTTITYGKLMTLFGTEANFDT
jgi:predicted deacetylase